VLGELDELVRGAALLILAGEVVSVYVMV